MLYRLVFGNNYSIGDRIILVVCYLATIYFAIVLHEFSHGLVAKWNGDDTAAQAGRLSLNPLKHFEPLGIVMFVLVGMGWARPVPVNSANFKNPKTGLITVALAGVTMNLLLSFVSFGMYVGMGALINSLTEVSDFWLVVVKLVYFSSYFGTFINISLIAFNLLPLFPLDGFRLVESFTPPHNAYVVFMRKYSMYIFLFLIGLGIVADATGWKCDVLGMYIQLIQDAITRLYGLILGV